MIPYAEGLVDPKVLAKKTVTDFGYPRGLTHHAEGWF
jgi:hypothetical protein